ncbi:MAG: peptidoglycan DD-metalloendopeptidase family protein [Nitrospiraceae bacterium]|nr:peptidoglycan DD-metalloendopeptidase family protein [Nitrospiraceae bacterium]
MNNSLDIMGMTSLSSSTELESAKVSAQYQSLKKVEGLNKSSDPQTFAKDIERVFLNELLKVMLEQTELGKNKTISTYLPVFTEQMAKDFSQKGIGISEFFLNNPGVQKLFKSNENALPAENQSIKIENIDKSDKTTDNGPEFQLPLDKKSRISSSFGYRTDPFTGKTKIHNGIDIPMPEGTPVMPASDGRVVFSGEKGGYGKTVVIYHENGFMSIYAHNSQNLVKEGDVVDKNTKIALSGSTGRSTGPHLHFEVRQDGTPLNPLKAATAYAKAAELEQSTAKG